MLRIRPTQSALTVVFLTAAADLALIARKFDDGTDVRFVELSPVVRN